MSEDQLQLTATRDVPTWADLVAHYRPGDRLAPLAGSSVLTVESSDQDGICIRQRLWRMCLRADHWEVARAVLCATSPTSALDFAEALRTYQQSGPDVVTDCSRTPNVTSVIMADLGLVQR